MRLLYHIIPFLATTQNSIRFLSATFEHSIHAQALQQLRRAIIDRNTVHFHYHTRHSSDGKSAASEREADPYGLVHFAGTWHLVAYCHLRQDVRNFRLDRMENLELLPKTFLRPPDMTMQQPKPRDDRNVVVRVVFDKEVARWVQESRSFYTVAEEEMSDGLLVTLHVRHENEVLQWLLSWGRHVQVLEPESLRKRMGEEAQEMLRNHPEHR